MDIGMRVNNQPSMLSIKGYNENSCHQDFGNVPCILWEARIFLEEYRFKFFRIWLNTTLNFKNIVLRIGL
jgi:hypothetical protein